MADNTQLSAAIGSGDVVRAEDRAGVKTQVVCLDLNPAGAETLMAGAMPVTGTFFQATQPVSIASAVPVTDNSGSLTVDAPVGTPVFVRLSDGTSAVATLPVSAASLPLPAGASTAAKQPALGTAGAASADVLTVQGVASMTPLKTDGSASTQPVSGTFWQATQPVSGTFWQATQPVSAASLPLPSGASTSARQPALGTAGSASADVLTVQGVASMTALKVDGSAATQPVSIGSTVTVTGAGGTFPVTTAADWPVKMGQPAATAGAITANGQTVSCSLSGYPTVSVSVSGTYTGLNAAFEVSDDGGTTWYSVLAARSDSATTEAATGALTSTARMWDVGVVGCTDVRVRATAFGSGTASFRFCPSAGAVEPALTVGIAGTVAATQSGAWAVTQSGTWTVQPGNTPNTSPWLVTDTPATSGGNSVYSVISSGAANQDAAAIKASAGQVYGYSLFNTTASARYVKLYNLASGATSASTPAMRIYLPPTGGANVDITKGVAFGTGISIRITTGAADSDAGACSANDVLANVFWK